MNNLTSIPSDFQSVIGSEKMDFSIIAKRKKPLKKSFFIIAFGMFWTGFISIFVVVFLGPIFRGEEAHFTTNGVPTTASWDNFKPMIGPALIIGFFVLIGLAMLFWGFYSMLQKGGYYVGTPNRLIHYYKGNITSYDWEQFSGNMEVNSIKGDISMELRTGSMESTRNRPDKYVPNIVYISGVEGVLEIAEICRKRIKENDPTPADLA